MGYSFSRELQESFTSIPYDAWGAKPYTSRVVFFNKNTGRLLRRRAASVSMKAIAWRESRHQDRQIACSFARALPSRLDLAGSCRLWP
jgi:hypothetical protein